jgi:hypothetical protein
MSRISNPSAPIDAPAIWSAGSITPPPDVVDGFRRENLSPSQHPAIRGGNAGGEVAHPANTVIDGAGGRMNRG